MHARGIADEEPRLPLEEGIDRDGAPVSEVVHQLCRIDSPHVAALQPGNGPEVGCRIEDDDPVSPPGGVEDGGDLCHARNRTEVAGKVEPPTG